MTSLPAQEVRLDGTFGHLERIRVEHRLGDHDARHRHHDVEVRVLLGHPVEQSAHGVVVGDVEDLGLHSLVRGDELVEQLSTAPRDDHAVARVVQANGQPTPGTRRGTGQEG